MQVKRSERQMLEELYDHMQGLQSFERETLMDEEPEIMQRRAAIKQVRCSAITTRGMAMC